MPSLIPSDVPSMIPSVSPTSIPSMVHTIIQTSTPSKMASDRPSMVPSSAPSSMVLSSTHSKGPASVPSNTRSTVSSLIPSDFPSSVPSNLPSTNPSDIPSLSPSSMPSDIPSSMPSSLPSVTLFGVQSDIQSDIPSDAPSNVPSDFPSSVPSMQPTLTPTFYFAPSDFPSSAPSIMDGKASVNSVSFDTSDERLMNMDEMSTYESICAEKFLPLYVPKVTLAEYSTIRCKVLSQSKQSGKLSILMRIAAKVAISNNEFQYTIATTLNEYSAEFQSLLGEYMQLFFISSNAPSSAPSGPFGSDGDPVIQQTESAVKIAPTENSLMNEESQAIFESVCANDFMPIFLPKTNGLTYVNITCKVKSQIITNSGIRRLLQPGSVTILLSVSASALEGPDDNFDYHVARTLVKYGDEFQLMLSKADPYFAPTTTDNFPSSVTQVGNLQNNSSVDDTTSILIYVGAGFAGVVLAIGVGLFLIGRSQEEEDNSTSEASVFELSNGTIVSKTVSKQGSDVTGPLIPPTQFGLQIPTSITQESFIEPQEDISPSSSMPISSTMSPRFVEDVIDVDLDDDSHIFSDIEDGVVNPDISQRAAYAMVNVCENNSATSDRYMLFSMSHEGCVVDSHKDDFVGEKTTPHGNRFLQMNTASAAHTGQVLDDLGKFEADQSRKLKPLSTSETPKVTNSTRYKI